MPMRPATPTARAWPADRFPAGHRRRDGGRRTVLALAALLGLGGLVLGGGFFWFLLLATAPPAEPDRHTDGIAVLTGGANRVETGLRLLRQGLGDRLLISGTHQLTELAALDPAAEADPALAARITLGRAATSTRGNAAEVAAWAGAAGLHSVRVVTSGYHMPRALAELRRTMPAMLLLPYPAQAGGAAAPAGRPAGPAMRGGATDPTAPATPLAPTGLATPMGPSGPGAPTGRATPGAPAAREPPRPWPQLGMEYLKFLAALLGVSGPLERLAAR